MTIKFEYTLEDVKKEFKDLLNDTSQFGRAGADFTEEEYIFRIEQLSSCAGQLMAENQKLKDAIEFFNDNKDQFEKFDPRYESRFISKETFELDRMLRETILEFNAKDDDFNHFVLLSALKHLNGVKPDDFEIRIFKEDIKLIRNNFEYIKNDFDYIELSFNDADMADYAEKIYNDGENNLALFSRKAFEDYLCDAIADTFSLIPEELGDYRSVYGAERNLLINVLSLLPDLNMKHSKNLASKVNSLFSDLNSFNINSFNIREVVANSLYAKWMKQYLDKKLDLDSLSKMIEQVGVKPDYSGMSYILRKRYKYLLDNNYFNRANALVKFTGVKPDEETMQELYIKWLDAEQFNTISWCIKLSDVKPDKKTMFQFYKQWLNREVFRYRITTGIELSDVQPDEELMAEFYSKWLGEGDLDRISGAIQITGVKPDYSKMTGQIMKRYKHYLDYDYFNSAKRLADLTGVKPDEETMRELYIKWLDAERFDTVSWCIKLSGVKPDKKTMFHFYRQWLNREVFRYRITTGIELSDVKPDEELMAEFYSKWLNDWDLDRISGAIQITGVKPDYTSMSDHIQKRYVYLLNNYGLNSASNLATLTGIKPSKETMLTFYKLWLENDMLEKFTRGLKLSDAKPDRETMSCFYKKCLEEGNIDYFETGIKLSGVRPNPDGIFDNVQKCYSTWFKNGRPDNIEKYIELTGIEPDYPMMAEKIQDGYRKLLKNRNFFLAVKCAGMSDIKPDSSVMSEFYNFALGRGYFSDVTEGIKFSGIEPDYTVMGKKIENGYIMKMIFGRSKDIDTGISLTGINPPDYVLTVCNAKEKLLGAFGL